MGDQPDFQLDSIARGRQLAEHYARTGELPVCQLPSMELRQYRQTQRKIAEQRGCCGHHEFRITSNGTRVCCHTGDPCGAELLAEIIKVWQNINGESTWTASK